MKKVVEAAAMTIRMIPTVVEDRSEIVSVSMRFKLRPILQNFFPGTDGSKNYFNNSFLEQFETQRICVS